MSTQPRRHRVAESASLIPSVRVPTLGHLHLRHPTKPPKAIPSTVVIDADGRVAARVLGTVDATTLSGIVSDVAADS